LAKRQPGQSDDEFLESSKEAAEAAAEAAAADPKWKALQQATTDLQLRQDDVFQASEDLETYDLGSHIPETLHDRVNDARTSLIAACRSVVAAGGDVDESLLDSS
jgi:hypothetical protein